MQMKAPRGTYDILPPESSKWHFMEKVLKETAELFGYREIRTPIFEHTELFKRGVGESTDIVTKEMYTFNDKAERSLTLRPEGTASCVRALVEHAVYGGLMPVKWYYTGPMFRYDRPQTGRYRQFHQFGIEVFGSNSPYIDAEVIIMLVEILSRLGLKNYELHLNSVGCRNCREVYRKKLIEHITPVRDKLCSDCKVRYMQNPLRVLDCKNESCHQAIAGYPTLYENLCDSCREHYALVRKALEDIGVIYIHDDNLVRGLDYYSNTAFEIHIPGIGAQSAIGGGGRYNGLVSDCGGPDIPGIGFAMGMERILLALDSISGSEIGESVVDVFVAVMDEKFEDIAVKVVHDLRRAGIKADKDYMKRSPRAQMKFADKLQAGLVVVIGEDEVRERFLTLRNMSNKAQQRVSHDELIDRIKGILQIG